MNLTVFPRKLVTKARDFVVDFAGVIPVGVTLVSSMAVLTVYRGTDTAVSSMLSGAVRVVGTQATQTLIGGVAGVEYVLSIIGTLSNGGVRIKTGYLYVTDVVQVSTRYPAVRYAVFTDAGVLKLKAKYFSVPAVKVLLDKVSVLAKASLSTAPSPLSVMDIEGNLHSSDAVVVNTDMDVLIACGLQYRFTNATQYLNQATRYLTAWASTYVPIGNPITEEVFYKLVAGYDLVKDSVTAAQRTVIESFMDRLFSTAQTFISLRDPVLSHSNFESRNLMLMTAIAYAQGDSSKQAYCLNLYTSQVDLNILAAGTIATSIPYAVGAAPGGMLNNPVVKGSTFDFYHRDAVEYHDASIGGLLLAAIVALNNGVNWYGIVSGQGKRLEDGISFALPYATGAQTHIDFVNSLVQPFDAGRVATFDPVNARNVISLAAMVNSTYVGRFDVSTLPLWEQLLYWSVV